MKSLYDKNRFLIFRDFKICLALISLSIILFSILAVFNMRGALHGFDVAILTGLADGRSGEIKVARYSEIMRDITSLGGTTLITLITTTTVLFLFLSGKRGKAVFLALTVAGGSLLSNTLKRVFDLSRPDIFPHGTDVSSMTFPSGHTFTGAVTYLTLAFLIYQLEIKLPLKIFVFGIAVFISFWIGGSRLYLGVHWPSDVIASWILAIGWCSLCWMTWLIYEYSCDKRLRCKSQNYD